MIVFESIRWKNFLSYGNYWTELKLDRSEMTLICGENGAGKTTFLDALTFCLFGKPFRNINIPQLANSINTKDCVVECVFKIGGVKYFIRRGLAPKLFEIHKDDKMIDQDSKSKDYQKMLEEHIIKMSYKAFCQVVILGSTNYVPFMRLPAADRRAIVESLLDISVFSSMNTVLKDRLSINKEDIRTCETSMEILDSKKNTQRKYLDALEEKSRSSLEGIDEEIKKNELVRDSLSDVVVKGGNILSNISKNRDLKRKKEQSISDLKRILSTLENKLNTMDMELSVLMTTEEVPCPSCGQSLTDEHRNKEIETKKTKREEVRVALLDVEKRISVEEKFIVDNKLTNVEQDYERFQSVLNEHRQKLAVAEKMIDRLLSDADKIKKSQQNLQKEQDLLDELENKCEDAKKHFNEKQEEQKLLSSAQSILKDSGIKTRVIKHYLPIMNK